MKALSLLEEIERARLARERLPLPPPRPGLAKTTPPQAESQDTLSLDRRELERLITRIVRRELAALILVPERSGARPRRPRIARGDR